MSVNSHLCWHLLYESFDSQHLGLLSSIAWRVSGYRCPLEWSGIPRSFFFDVENACVEGSHLRCFVRVSSIFTALHFVRSGYDAVSKPPDQRIQHNNTPLQHHNFGNSQPTMSPLPFPYLYNYIFQKYEPETFLQSIKWLTCNLISGSRESIIPSENVACCRHRCCYRLWNNHWDHTDWEDCFLNLTF